VAHHAALAAVPEPEPVDLDEVLADVVPIRPGVNIPPPPPPVAAVELASQKLPPAYPRTPFWPIVLAFILLGVYAAITLTIAGWPR
jgi:hypothetical protein